MFRINNWLFWISLILFQPLFAHASDLEYRDFNLDNGLRVILVRENKAAIIVSQMWYRVGASDETSGKTGLAHMLEHMMFQGTQDLAPAEFSHIVSRNGGEDNASTAQDYTNYFIKLASDRLDLGLRLEADRMNNLLLNQEEFVSENKVVQEERRTRTDSNPTSRFMEQYTSLIYQNHPYSQPIIGWMDDIKAHTLEDLKSWYKRFYAPNNAILVLVGDLDFEKTTQLIHTYFGPIASQPKIQRTPLPKWKPRKSGQQRFEVSDKAVKLSHWYGKYPVPTLSTSTPKKVFALEVMATLLGATGSSRLYENLVVNQKVAVSASAGYGGYSRGWESFTLSAIPTPGTSLKTLETAVLKQVTQLTEGTISERELQRAKNGLIAGHVFAQDSIYHLAWSIGRLSSNGVDWRMDLMDYPKHVSEITIADVQRVAKEYLAPERLTIGILKP